MQPRDRLLMVTKTHFKAPIDPTAMLLFLSCSKNTALLQGFMIYCSCSEIFLSLPLAFPSPQKKQAFKTNQYFQSHKHRESRNSSPDRNTRKKLQETHVLRKSLQGCFILQAGEGPLRREFWL